ncbi:MAG TPA: MdtA/MuxA family multidrug efflux RND transporter periplasmic adaptor subunit [Bryobacteraceae bacterium]|jgi:multidrug efflux system membrane fusion protein|nr:MdtA/MuxA family multidrug efflux RND transporter periplasmic adaptor subunit [Bryobacteraceae bacterium]
MSYPTPEITAPEHEPALLPPAPEKAAPPREPPRAKPRKRKWPWVVLALLLALAGAAWIYSRMTVPAKTGAAASGRGGRGGGAATPVVVARAQKGDIGVYYTGLGAITPLNTVTIRSRVDGQLMQVYFHEGDEVHIGDRLIEIDPRPYQAVVTQTQGQLARDQALLQNARVDQTRYETLLAQDAIPEQQLATQRALVTQYEGTVKNDEGLVAAAQLNVTYTHITSPVDGIVGLRLVDPGNIVHASDANGMIVITQLQPISVIFTLPEDQLDPVLQKLRARQKLPVEAWDRDMKRKLETGTLATVDNQIDPTTGTLKLRAIFDNNSRLLFPNEFVNTRLLVQEKTGVTLLETAAVQRNTQNTYVYLVKPDNTVTVRNITLGTTEGDESEITSGLTPGDTVVMTGVDKLQEGSKVIPHNGQPAGAPVAGTTTGGLKSTGTTTSGPAPGGSNTAPAGQTTTP